MLFSRKDYTRERRAWSAHRSSLYRSVQQRREENDVVWLDRKVALINRREVHKKEDAKRKKEDAKAEAETIRYRHNSSIVARHIGTDTTSGVCKG